MKLGLMLNLSGLHACELVVYLSLGLVWLILYIHLKYVNHYIYCCRYKFYNLNSYTSMGKIRFDIS